MRTSWILGGLICLAVGVFLTFTIIGALLGVPLAVIGVIIFLLGFVIPRKKPKKAEASRHSRKK